MTTALFFAVITAVVWLAFEVRGYARNVHALVVLIERDLIVVEEKTSPAPPSAPQSIKCKVHLCGCLAVVDGYCEKHSEECPC